MIIEWTLKNFKSIKKLDQFHISPVTVLAGANSSGKTTLLQSILLLSQTLSSPVGTRLLVLNGDQVKLGTWADVPHADLEAEPVEFKCILEIPRDISLEFTESNVIVGRASLRSRRWLRNISKITLSVSLRSLKSKGRMLSEPTIDSVRVGIEVPFTTGTRARTYKELETNIRRRKKLRSRKELDELVPLLPTGIDESTLNYIVEETQRQLEFEFGDEFGFEGPSIIPTSNLGASFVHCLPNRLIRKYDATARQINEQIKYLLSSWTTRSQKRTAANNLVKLTQSTTNEKPEKLVRQMARCINNFLEFFDVKEKIKALTSTEIISHLISLQSKLRTQRRLPELSFILSLDWQDIIPKKAREFAIESVTVSEPLRTGMVILRNFFANNVKYLGPLRDEPRVIYALPPTPEVADVGIKGEYTAVVLDRYKNRIVSFKDPISKRTRKMTLQDAVCFWLNYMGILESVSTLDAGKLGYRLNVRAPELDRDLDLTTVGVGASQVLPILVMALLAEPNTLLIFEQPEIHLHPRVQSMLGDFFLSMGQVGKRCLIETHSEYLVNQLRNRIVEAKDDEILKLINICFVERKGNQSLFKEIKIDEYGAILNWPTGFFDEGTVQTESIIRMRTTKRKTRQQQDQ